MCFFDTGEGVRAIVAVDVRFTAGLKLKKWYEFPDGVLVAVRCSTLDCSS